jgi:hypothetical protein
MNQLNLQAMIKQELVKQGLLNIDDVEEKYLYFMDRDIQISAVKSE